MSWFDATGFANLAKSALKEAQKTIDKALDIKDDEQGQQILPVSSPSSPSEDTDAFFDNWGLKNSGAARKPVTSESPSHVSQLPKESEQGDAHKADGKLAISTSLWGSFTGSFFDNPPGGEGRSQDGDPVSSQPKKSTFFRSSSESHEVSSGGGGNDDAHKTGWEQVDLFKRAEAELCDDSSEFGFSRSKLVVESEDGDADARSRLSSCEADEVEPAQDSYVALEPVRRREHSTSSYRYNRLSVISSESDKKSSESVEVIGCGSGFTTSPDTPTSPGTSGTSSNFRLSMAASTPESVEVIPDTPSSVEVIADSCSGRTSRTTSSPYVSPRAPLPGAAPPPPTAWRSSRKMTWKKTATLQRRRARPLRP